MQYNINEYPKGLKKFVNDALDLMDVQRLYREYSELGGVRDGGRAVWTYLIKRFLRVEMVFDKSAVSEEYKKVVRVGDLPERDIKMCLLYIGYLLGVTEHTGGQNFYNLYLTRIVNFPK